jgi:transcriptional antiterminator NusG
MTLYVIQVKTGGEEKFLKHVSSHGGEAEIVWPRRRLRIRRRGSWRDSLAPIFPGYLFLKTAHVEPELYWRLRRTPGFLRFLQDNHHIEPLSPHDLGIVLHFLSFGEIVDKSVVSFDANQRIRVISGPLKDMEGRIVKVDRRKGRAKVCLELYENSFMIDFGFESLGQAAGGREPNTRERGRAAEKGVK